MISGERPILFDPVENPVLGMLNLNGLILGHVFGQCPVLQRSSDGEGGSVGRTVEGTTA